VRPAESGQEVIKRHLVRQVDGGELQAPLVAIAMKHKGSETRLYAEPSGTMELEMEAQLCCIRPWRNVVGSSES
jgi:hypothetical protein